MTVHGRKMELPLSHSLPLYLKQFPLYDALPRRMSEYIHRRQTTLACVDVGANIGDTVAAFLGNRSDRFLAIEPHPKFASYCARNWAWNANVVVIRDLCSNRNDESTVVITEEKGTASIVEGAANVEMRRRTLDSIVSEVWPADHIDIVKIDTDGHDFAVLQGAVSTISNNMPMVLFECDAFSDPEYVSKCLDALQSFRQLGYKSCLLYDNYGYLMARVNLDETAAIRQFLFYQLTSPFYYFDILVMKEDDMNGFYREEVEFFGRCRPHVALSPIVLADLVSNNE